MKRYYFCTGPVMGGCGMRHRTREAAERHIERESRQIARMPGNSSGSLTRSYSDRQVVEVLADNPVRRPVTLSHRYQFHTNRAEPAAGLFKKSACEFNTEEEETWKLLYKG